MEQKLLFQVNDPKIPFYNDTTGDITAEARALITKKRRYKLSARPDLVIDEKKDDKGTIVGYTIKDNKKKRTFKVKETGTGEKAKWTISVYQKEAKKKDKAIFTSRYPTVYERETFLVPLQQQLEKLGYSPKHIKTLVAKAFKKVRSDLNTCHLDTNECLVDQFIEKKMVPVRKQIQELKSSPASPSKK